jgi:hypothetical protein
MSHLVQLHQLQLETWLIELSTLLRSSEGLHGLSMATTIC